MTTTDDDIKLEGKEQALSFTSNSEMGQRATTDIDEIRSHSNEIISIVERRDRLVFFQQDKDWFYRTDERRWITMNDHSSWRKAEMANGEAQVSILHIA